MEKQERINQIIKKYLSGGITSVEQTELRHLCKETKQSLKSVLMLPSEKQVAPDPNAIEKAKDLLDGLIDTVEERGYKRGWAYFQLKNKVGEQVADIVWREFLEEQDD